MQRKLVNDIRFENDRYIMSSFDLMQMLINNAEETAKVVAWDDDDFVFSLSVRMASKRMNELNHFIEKQAELAELDRLIDSDSSTPKKPALHIVPSKPQE